SNIHDTEYAVGSINFTGAMPVILTQDGPSLGGLVCPVNIVRAVLWKVGPVNPGDRIRSRRLSFATPRAVEQAAGASIAALQAQPPAPALPEPVRDHGLSECILACLPPSGSRPLVTYRQAGDRYILLEYGENVLDLRLRLRVHALMEALRAAPVEG